MHTVMGPSEGAEETPAAVEEDGGGQSADQQPQQTPDRYGRDNPSPGGLSAGTSSQELTHRRERIVVQCDVSEWWYD